MSFGACGFNMAPALLLIFTRVLMLQTHRKHSPFNNTNNKPYKSNHGDVLQCIAFKNILSWLEILILHYFLLLLCIIHIFTHI